MNNLAVQMLTAISFLYGAQCAPIGRPPNKAQTPQYPVLPKVRPEARQKKGFGFAYEPPKNNAPSLYAQGIVGKPQGDGLGGYEAPKAKPTLYSLGYTGQKKYAVPKAKPSLYSQGYGLNASKSIEQYKSPMPSAPYVAPQEPPIALAENTQTAISSFGIFAGIGVVTSFVLLGLWTQEKSRSAEESLLSEDEAQLRNARGGGRLRNGLLVLSLGGLFSCYCGILAPSAVAVREPDLQEPSTLAAFAQPAARLRQARPSWQPVLPSQAMMTRTSGLLRAEAAVAEAPAKAEVAAVPAKEEARAWIDAFLARSSGGGAAAAASAPSGGGGGAGGPIQELLKKTWEDREKAGVELAQFYVKAKRHIKAQGADVAEGTYGVRCSGLIQWDNGCYSSESLAFAPDSNEKVAFGGDFELAKARMSPEEAKAWREEYRAKFAPRGNAATQEELKKVFEKRQEAKIDIASIPIKALRQITAQGADVPADTTGLLEGTLIRWDNGQYSDNLRRSQDFEVARPREAYAP